MKISEGYFQGESNKALRHKETEVTKEYYFVPLGLRSFVPGIFG
jgi:hypothetical protein